MKVCDSVVSSMSARARWNTIVCSIPFSGCSQVSRSFSTCASSIFFRRRICAPRYASSSDVPAEFPFDPLTIRAAVLGPAATAAAAAAACAAAIAAVLVGCGGGRVAAGTSEEMTSCQFACVLLGCPPSIVGRRFAPSVLLHSSPPRFSSFVYFPVNYY